nr:Parkinson disease 7 domain-containing protein 1 isoform X7 [Columba livia]
MRHHCPGRERGPGPGAGAWRLVRPGPGCPVVPRSSRGASSRPGMAPEPPHKHLSLLGPQASPGQGSAWNRRWRWRVGEGEGLGRVAALRRAWQRCRGWGSPLQEMSVLEAVTVISVTDIQERAFAQSSHALSSPKRRNYLASCARNTNGLPAFTPASQIQSQAAQEDRALHPSLTSILQQRRPEHRRC